SHLWVHRLAHDDLRASRRMLRDEARIGGDGRAVIAGCIRHVHTGELADRRLVLEDRLQNTLAHLRLVGRIGGQELPARKERVDDCRDIVVVDARTEKREFLPGVDVLRRELAEVRSELLLGQRRLQLERSAELNARWNVAEQIFDRGDADRGEHPLSVGVRQRQVAHARYCSVRRCVYACTSSNPSASVGSASRMRTSQPCPYGSAFTVSGSSTTRSLTASTSPESGEM